MAADNGIVGINDAAERRRRFGGSRSLQLGDCRSAAAITSDCKLQSRFRCSTAVPAAAVCDTQVDTIECLGSLIGKRSADPLAILTGAPIAARRHPRHFFQAAAHVRPGARRSQPSLMQPQAAQLSPRKRTLNHIATPAAHYLGRRRVLTMPVISGRWRPGSR